MDNNGTNQTEFPSLHCYRWPESCPEGRQELLSSSAHYFPFLSLQKKGLKQESIGEHPFTWKVWVPPPVKIQCWVSFPDYKPKAEIFLSVNSSKEDYKTKLTVNLYHCSLAPNCRNNTLAKSSIPHKLQQSAIINSSVNEVWLPVLCDATHKCHLPFTAYWS